jgi:outer membrane protein assembly factor BamA
MAVHAAFTRLPIVLTIALSMLPCAAARAQETREQQIAKQQAEKAIRLGEEGPDKAEQIIVRFRKSPVVAGSGGPFPLFGSVYEGTGFGFGGGYLHRLSRSSHVSVAAGVSINGSTTLRADYDAPRFASNRASPYASARWTRAKDVAFYGIGNDSTPDARGGYDFDPTVVSAGIGYRLTDSLTVSAGYEHFSFTTHVHGPPIDRIPLEELSDGTRLRFNGGVFAVAYDTRTSPRYSTHGTLLRATTKYYAETADKPFELRQSELEAVQLIPLVREHFVLAFRGLATFTIPDAGNFAPLGFLPYIGSGRTLRGFDNRRFVDRDRVVLTGEYRWRPSRYLDMALFVDSGQVSPDVNTLAWDRMRTSWGIGARFHGPTFSALRVELARSPEGYQLVFATGPAF